MVERFVLESPVGRLHIAPPPGYVLRDASWADDGVLAQVLVATDVNHCQSCGRSDVRRYGYGPVTILDAPSGGVRARMRVDRQRVECPVCNVLSRQPLPDVRDGHRYTDRCADWMTSQMKLRTYAAMGEVLGFTEKSVRMFAAEQGISRRGTPKLTVTAQCQSCLRVLSSSQGDVVNVHHPPPGKTELEVIALCSDCHAHPEGRWISRI